MPRILAIIASVVIAACGRPPKCETACGATGDDVSCPDLLRAERAFLEAFVPVWSKPASCAALARTHVFALPGTQDGYLRYDPKEPTLLGRFYSGDGTVLIADVPLVKGSLAHEWAHAVDYYASWEEGGRRDFDHSTWTARGVNDALRLFPLYYAQVATEAP